MTNNGGEYQTIRFTLLNHKEASIYHVLSSLHFLIENKLMHKEWKRFELDLFDRYRARLSNLSMRDIFPTESVGELLSALFRSTSGSDELPHIVILEEILSEIEVDDQMRDELLLYDRILTGRAKANIVESLETAMQFLDKREDAVSIVMEWYGLGLFMNPTLYSTEQR